MFFKKKDKNKKFEEMSLESEDIPETTISKQTDKNMENTEQLKVPQSAPEVKAISNQIPSPDKLKNMAPPRMKAFDIMVVDEDIDDNGNTVHGAEHPEYGVQAGSARELIKLFAECGQKIRILREYPIGGPPMPPQQNQINQDVDRILANGQVPYPQQSGFIPPPQALPFQQPRAPEPPKFFEIGGIKCKLENGIMFQEQWVRVDASKYRLISDKTNKIVPMTDKHLETLKWVQISSEDKENA